MKHLTIITLLLMAGCEESTPTATTQKRAFKLPSGTTIMCEHADALSGSLVLTGCDATLFSQSGRIECKDGVCWGDE